jgi:Ca2+-transporting ATPase
LEPDEARRRLEQYGPNEIERARTVSAVAIFFAQFRNTLVVILLLAAGLSALVGEAVDAVIILAIVVFSASLGFIQEYRAERAVESLERMLQPTTRVIRGGKSQMVPSRELVPGDLVLLETGDRLAADARLLQAHSLRCDEAPLTGESLPVPKSCEAVPREAPTAERSCMVFSGTTVAYGRGRGVVAATGMHSELGQIAREVAAIDTGKTPLEKRTAEIGRWLAVTSLTICALVVAISLLRGFLDNTLNSDFALTMVMFAVALAVAAVPEALAAIVTGALALGMRAMARHNALIKRMPAVETLGCTTVICTDKTGTLTRGEMTIRRLYVAQQTLEVSGAGYAPEGEIRAEGEAPAGDSLNALLRAGVLCNDAEHLCDGECWRIRGDPTEGAFLVAAGKAGLSVDSERQRAPRVDELPFSSERKRMSTVHTLSGGERLVVLKGAPEAVLAGCTHILEEDGAVVALTDARRAALMAVNEEMASQALRVLGVAHRLLERTSAATGEALEQGMVFLGLAGMMDPPRAEALEAVRVCRTVGIRPVMITGDQELTALAIARELGIFVGDERLLSGAALEKMTDIELESVIDQVSVYARVSPLHKLKIVRAWQTRGEVVAMTGDGVNDAPALKHADIGVAMGVSGTDVAREAADMVLADDNFATIVTAIERGRWIYDNIKKYLAYLLQCNITEVVVIGGIVLLTGPEFLPLLPAAILYINLATDGLPALALGVSPPDRDIMRRTPRRPDESVFGWDVKSFVLRAVLIECPVLFFVFFRHINDIEHARTMVFFLFVVIEFVVALNCRSLVHSIIDAPPHKWLVIALTWELVLVAALVQVPAIRESFGIGLPSPGDLAMICGFGLVVMGFIEATKLLLRRRPRPPATGAHAKGR